MASITFLGTGGGRFVVLSQRRYSGGIWLDLECRIIIDPGPGALIRALQFGKNPQKLDAIFVSHKHLDHYSDTEILIEAMTYGMKEDRGTLVIEKNTLEYISDYHKKAVNLIIPEPGNEFNIGDIKVETIPTFMHVDAIGFKFFSEHGIITYSSDTDYNKKLIPYYKKSKILILNSISPSGREIKTHLNVDKVIEIARNAKPDLLILNHFGMQMLNANPEREAKRVEDKTGVKTIAARDGMEIDLELKKKERQTTLI